MDILLLDNYDSFTHNLAHLCYQVLDGADRLNVVRNDDVSLSALTQAPPDAFIISPGPGNPDQAGMCLTLIEALAPSTPLFGVCLGMQAIGKVHGWQVVQTTPVHGKRDWVYHGDNGDPPCPPNTRSHVMFDGIPSPFQTVRYHSLCIDPQETSQDTLLVTAKTQDHVPMAIASTLYPLTWGVQFHPESIGSDYGTTLLENFFSHARLFSNNTGKGQRGSLQEPVASS